MGKNLACCRLDVVQPRPAFRVRHFAPYEILQFHHVPKIITGYDCGIFAKLFYLCACFATSGLPVLPDGVMVTHRFLVPFFQVRVLVGEQALSSAGGFFMP